MTLSSAMPMIHSGSGIQRCSMPAPTTTSTATTITQKYQYSQPEVKPAQSPRPIRLYSVNAPMPGMAMAISPSIRITSSTIRPASA
ncbi:hypothetical protein D9M70_590680 [compost metagenome]